MLSVTHPRTAKVINDQLVLANELHLDDSPEAVALIQSVSRFTISDVESYLEELDPECDASEIAELRNALREDAR